jgi:hypothetical protein
MDRTEAAEMLLTHALDEIITDDALMSTLGEHAARGAAEREQPACVRACTRRLICPCCPTPTGSKGRCPAVSALFPVAVVGMWFTQKRRRRIQGWTAQRQRRPPLRKTKPYRTGSHQPPLHQRRIGVHPPERLQPRRRQRWLSSERTRRLGLPPRVNRLE